jgi:hypothetical protein
VIRVGEPIAKGFNYFILWFDKNISKNCLHNDHRLIGLI